VTPALAGIPLLTLLDALLSLIAVEAALLLWWHRRTGDGLRPAVLLPTLAAGGGIVLAWRASVADASPLWVGAAMAVAGTAHLLDLARRWQRGTGR
jgi:hypothetical protein